MRINWDSKVCQHLVYAGPMTHEVLRAYMLEHEGLPLESYTTNRMKSEGLLVEREDGTLYPTRKGALRGAGTIPADPHGFMDKWKNQE